MKNYTKQEILKIILSVAKEYDEKLNDKHFYRYNTTTGEESDLMANFTV